MPHDRVSGTQPDVSDPLLWSMNSSISAFGGIAKISEENTIMKSRVLVSLAAIGVATVGSTLVGTSPAAALTGTVTAAQFVAACAAGPINLQPSAKVEFGTASVVGGCTVNVPLTGALEFVDTNLTFGGPLVVNGSSTSKWEVVNSNVTAASVTANFTGTENAFKVDKGLVRATAGNVRIAMGPIAMVQIAYPGLGSPNSLQATGAVNISGGDKLFLELNQARVQAGSVVVAMNGTEGLLKAEGATVVAAGAISVTSTGMKAMLESTGSTFQAGGALTVGLAAAESAVKGTASTFRAGEALIVSASAGAGTGLVELSGPGGVLQGATVAVRASTGATGQLGTLNVGLNTIRATAGAATIDAGPMGSVGVKESTITAATLARASTGLGGVCVADLNTVTAPTQSMCV